jgi:hypothetical protein
MNSPRILAKGTVVTLVNLSISAFFLLQNTSWICAAGTAFPLIALC